MVEIRSITIYPIKSCRGVSVDEALVESRGLQRDRRFMLVDANGRFVTQRRHPRMAQIRVKLARSGGLEVAAPGMDPLEIPAEPQYSNERNVKIWRSSVDAAIADARTNEWFADYMGFACELAFMGDRHRRPVAHESAKRGDEVSFADGSPLLLISEASLADLNGRLESPVGMTRFRPNLVVSASEPFAEDNWRRIRAGDAELDVAWPCSRCILTTIDPETSEKHPAGEPLETLKTYRRRGAQVMFGQNLIPRRTGRIRVGDVVDAR